MAKLEVFKQIAGDFADIAEFIIIYIEEAHPTDGWVLGGNKYNFQQPKTLEERIDAAEILLECDFPCPILVDSIDNKTNEQYAALPERLYIIYDSVVALIGGKGPDDYNPDEVIDWLTKFKNGK